MRTLTAMEKYENLGLVGEGSYGMVMKCRHKETNQTVAIKKFIESEDDKMVKKIALREVRMLKQLRHENLVNLIEVFRRKKRLYLVFEFVDHTILDELERYPNGLEDNVVRRCMWQVLKGIDFCHNHNIIHRDIKPENILVSKSGIVKLCDFGFARTIAGPGEIYTDYVATRWYRAPELLVGDTKYGKAVDIWALGCLQAEMCTGEPLFPGDSDIDQLYHIIKCFGNLIQRHKEVFMKNPLFVGMRLPEVRNVEPLEKRFPSLTGLSVTVMKSCLHLDPDERPTCSQLLRHDFFKKDGFDEKFPSELRVKIAKEFDCNPLLRPSGEEKEGGGEEKKKSKKSKKDQSHSHSDKEREREKYKKRHSDADRHKISSTPPDYSDASDPHKKTSSKTGSGSPIPTITPTSKMLPSTVTASHNSSSNPPLQSQGGSSSQAPISTINVGTIGASKGSHTSNNTSGPPHLRASDKVKKGTTNTYYKKPAQPPPAHHSTSMTTPVQSEKTMLHERTLQFDVLMASQRKSKGTSSPKLEREITHLPNLAGLDVDSNKRSDKKPKIKKSQHTPMPHIGLHNDPGHSGANGSHLNQSSSADDFREHNLPAV
ncbi:cyclin-dependent kinase-like 4 isoform X2 [Patiria miniata]|uniref:Cyclin-dependent kinase-like 2 n=1 Tax=Patiria miniata TaxID=46514 RepID=A0A914A8H8_PATMI|nr:cyclin-dependent kinase-like 4 isoform X2 [Patiria miniata]